MKYELTKTDTSEIIHKKHLKKLKKATDNILELKNRTLSTDLVEFCNLVTYYTNQDINIETYRNDNGDRIKPYRDYLSIQTGINENGYENTKKRHYVIHFERKARIKGYKCREYNEYEGNIINLYCLADNIDDCISEFETRYSEAIR